MPEPSPITALCDQLEQLRAAATPGEWSRWRDQESVPGWDGFIVIGDDAAEGEECNPTARVYVAPDAALIAAAVNAVPRLVAALRAVEALAEDMEQATKPPVLSEFDRGVAATYVDVVSQLRAALATGAGS